MAYSAASRAIARSYVFNARAGNTACTGDIPGETHGEIQYRCNSSRHFFPALIHPSFHPRADVGSASEFLWQPNQIGCHRQQAAPEGPRPSAMESRLRAAQIGVVIGARRSRPSHHRCSAPCESTQPPAAPLAHSTRSPSHADRAAPGRCRRGSSRPSGRTTIHRAPAP